MLISESKPTNGQCCLVYQCGILFTAKAEFIQNQGFHPDWWKIDFAADIQCCGENTVRMLADDEWYSLSDALSLLGKLP